jgi:hypothetical protein
MDHYFDGIQGWFNFQGPYKQAVREFQDGSVFVELGCWKGKSASFLCVEVANSGKEISLNFIDHWGGSDEEDHKADAELERVFDIFKSNVAKSGVKTSVHRMSTVEAAKKFDDCSVDFIWVDAGHEYEDVMADLEAWWPKLKVQGIIGGDDFPMLGVESAVKEFFPAFETGSENGWSWWRVRKRG